MDTQFNTLDSIKSDDIQINKNLQFNNEIISHNIIIELLRITILVYNYGNDFQLENSEQTIEEFICKINTNSEFCKNIKLNDFRKNILYEIDNCNSTSTVYKFISDKETDIQVGITINNKDKRICVIFRGSESLYDWYYDLHIGKHKLNENIMVHSGFYKQLHDTNVYNTLVKEIKYLLEINPNYSIYITGHSLGAALSTLFGYLLSFEIENDIIIVSFASPRVGNNEWKISFENKKNIKHYRITNNRDIVTAFPYYDYKHVGHNIRLFENNVSTYYNYQDESWYDFSILRCWCISDHNSELYYKNLLNNKW